MKKKVILAVSISALAVIAAAFTYIGISTNVINEGAYRSRALAFASQNKTPKESIENSEDAEVSLTKLRGTPLAQANFSEKANRFLLFLNGGRAVKVAFRTDADGLLGPISVYYNPFTKQCVGSDYRF